MRNIFFVINEEDRTFEYWSNGKCITDYFDLDSGEGDLMSQLVDFSDVPVFQRCSKGKMWKIINKNKK